MRTTFKLPSLAYNFRSISFQWPLLGCYAALLFVGATLPSDGGHGLLNPKSLFFISTVGLAGLHVVFTYLLNVSRFFILLVNGFLVSWLAVAWIVSLRDPDYVLAAPFDQFKMFFLTVTVGCVTVYLVRSQLCTAQKVIRIVILANFCFSLAKIGLLVGHLLGVIDLTTFIAKIGIRFMSMNIYAQLVRMQASVDVLTPFLLYFLLQSKRLKLGFSVTFRWIYLLVSILSIFLSFSRFLMVVGGCSILFYILSLHPRRQILVWITIVGLALSALFIIGVEPVFTVIERRFFSSEVADSDEVRVVQSRALMAEFDNTPFFGKGLGSCAPDCIRDLLLPHSYEVQWLAFLMQFGLIGIMGWLVPLSYCMLRLLFPPLSMTSLGFALLFGLYLISGLTNPFMISLASGILYAIFFLSKECVDQVDLLHKK